MLLPVFAMAPQLTGVSEPSPHDKPPIYRLFATATSSAGVSEASPHDKPPIWRLFATSVALAGETDGQLRGCQGEKESD